MANISYDSPASLAPTIGFQPNGFLGGMWAGQRNDNYQQAVDQSNLMKAMAAKEQMNQLNDYNANAPVRDAQRLSQIAGFNANAANIGNIQAGQGAIGQAQQLTAMPEAQQKIKQWLQSQKEWKQEDVVRQATNMSAVGDTLFNIPGGDTLEGQAQRQQTLQKLKQQFPDLELPDQWNQQTEQQVFQKYQMAKTLHQVALQDAVTKEKVKGEYDLAGRSITADSNEKIQAAHDSARLQVARDADARVKSFEGEISKLLTVPPEQRTPAQRQHLAELQHERDIASAARMSALGITYGMLGNGSVTPTQVGTDAVATVNAIRKAGNPNNPVQGPTIVDMSKLKP